MHMNLKEEIDGASKDLGVELLGISSVWRQVYPRLTDILGAAEHHIHGTSCHFHSKVDR